MAFYQKTQIPRGESLVETAQGITDVWCYHLYSNAQSDTDATAYAALTSLGIPAFGAQHPTITTINVVNRDIKRIEGSANPWLFLCTITFGYGTGSFDTAQARQVSFDYQPVTENVVRAWRERDQYDPDNTSGQPFVNATVTNSVRDPLPDGLQRTHHDLVISYRFTRSTLPHAAIEACKGTVNLNQQRINVADYDRTFDRHALIFAPGRIDYDGSTGLWRAEYLFFNRDSPPAPFPQPPGGYSYGWRRFTPDRGFRRTKAWIHEDGVWKPSLYQITDKAGDPVTTPQSLNSLGDALLPGELERVWPLTGWRVEEFANWTTLMAGL